MKKILFLTLLPYFLQAQTPGIVHSGPKGIFITLGEHPPGMKYGSYKIERSEGGAFKTLTVLEPVKDKAALLKNMLSSKDWVDYPLDIRIFNTDKLWNTVKKAGSISALKTLGQSLPVMAGFHLMWLDKTAQIGKTYHYRITSPGFTLLSENIRFIPTAVSPLEIKSAMFLKGIFHFKLSSYGNDKPLWVDVYRASPGKEFEKLPAEAFISNKGDTLMYNLRDSSAKPYALYRYCFQGFDAFGNASRFSDTLLTGALDPTQMPLPEKVSFKPDSTGIELSWKLQMPDLVQTVRVLRHTSSDGVFEVLAELAPAQVQYKDETSRPGKPYFYSFELQYKHLKETKRTTVYSSVRHSFRPPASVKALQAEEQKEGTGLRWQIQEDEIIGFHLYRQINNSGFHLATEILTAEAGTKEFQHVDVHQGHGNTYHYFITALSSSYIEGQPSDTVTLVSKRNLPRPKVPVDLEISRREDRTWISWAALPDVAGYQILRQRGKVRDTVATARNFFVDSLTADSYSVRSLSWAGTASSFSAVLKPMRAKPQVPSPPSTVSARPTRAGGIQITWQKPLGTGTLAYHIFRYERGKPPVKVGTTTGDSFTDKAVTRGKVYYYFIRTRNADGMESENSHETHFTF